MSPVKERPEQSEAEDFLAADFVSEGLITNSAPLLDNCFVYIGGGAWGVTGRENLAKGERREPYPSADALRHTVEIVGIRTPFSSTLRQGLRLAQVQSYEPALKLLAELYDRVALPVDSLRTDNGASIVIAVGMLAAAGLCDVSPDAVRLSPEGKDLVEFLTHDDSVALREA